jgi:transcriptional regulator GlxA family with amidase domain
MISTKLPKAIVVVAFNGVELLDVTGPSAVFAKAEQLRPRSYKLIIASPTGGEVVSGSGLVLARTISVCNLPETIDTILITGGEERDLQRVVFDQGLAKWIEVVASKTRRIGSVCTGAFVLAAAGLLDDRRATTHWRSCDLLQQMCAAARVESDVIYTVDGQIYTSAGVAAGIDLALALVEEDYGRALASEVARELVLFVRRPGGQAQLSTGLAAQANASNRLADLVTWIIDHPNADLSVPKLAEQAGMSERNFARTFRQQTGKTPARFVEQTRLEHARDLLQHSDWPLDRLAQRSGFGSTDAMQRAFRSTYGITAGEYRGSVVIQTKSIS